MISGNCFFFFEFSSVFAISRRSGYAEELYFLRPYCLGTAATTAADAILESTEPGERLGILAQSNVFGVRQRPYLHFVRTSLCPHQYRSFPLERRIDSIDSISHCSLLVSDDYSRRRCGELIPRTRARRAWGRDVSGTRPTSAPDGSLTFAASSLVREQIRRFTYIHVYLWNGGHSQRCCRSRGGTIMVAYLHAVPRLRPSHPGTRYTQDV